MVLYTPDIVINSFAIPDENVDITGYVAEVELPKVVGKTKKYDILKFTIKNNETSVVQCCLWGQAPIQTYKDQIHTGAIVQIGSAELEAINPRFHKRGLASFEIHISENSTLTFHGKHEAGDDDEESAVATNFADIHTKNGLIAIEGYIGQRFVVKSQGSNQRAMYATGAITDGHFKINVKVMDYSSAFDHLVKGRKVMVVGTISVVDNTDIVQIVCKNFSSIRLTDGQMAEEQLMLGVSPKRKAP